MSPEKFSFTPSLMRPKVSPKSSKSSTSLISPPQADKSRVNKTIMIKAINILTVFHSLIKNLLENKIAITNKTDKGRKSSMMFLSPHLIQKPP